MTNPSLTKAKASPMGVTMAMLRDSRKKELFMQATRQHLVSIIQQE